jgi:phosphoserine phosphatase
MTEILALWRTTSTRKAITDFVAKVTDESSPDYVAPEERIATFDCDGTLLCEKPVKFQVAWVVQRLASMAENDPSPRSRQPFKGDSEQDDAWFSDAIAKHDDGDGRDLEVLLVATARAFSDTNVEAFARQAAEYLETAQHPVYQVSYLETTYRPMVELLGYLADNGFTSYIVSGSGRDFMRPVTQQLFGIPPERVLGSDSTESFTSDDRGAHVMRGDSVGVFDVGPAKPIAIWDHIGRRPILAAGNSNGDIPMLEYAQREGHPTLRLLVNHDDAVRETVYTAGAEKAMREATDEGWTVISIKDDWKQVFSFQNGG